MEIKNWEKIIEELYNSNAIGYRILNLDLSQPRNNEPFQIVGNFLQILDIPNNPPKIEIIFNDIYEYAVPIKEKEQFITPFRKFFISNEAGSGYLKLFIGKNFELTPYTKAYFNDNNIVNKLEQIYNALTNLKIDVDTININTDEVENLLSNIDNHLMYYIYSRLGELLNINGRLQNIENILNATLRFISRKNIITKYVVLNPNDYIDINLDPNGRYFGISNISDTDSILVYFNYPYDYIKLKYNSSFNIEKPITNQIKIFNNSTNPVEINYWYTVEP